jgi:CxxC motif-containing protein
MKREITCIVRPRGCRMTANIHGEVITDNICGTRIVATKEIY